jgi:hypothetical protein
MAVAAVHIAPGKDKFEDIIPKSYAGENPMMHDLSGVSDLGKLILNVAWDLTDSRAALGYIYL